MKGFKNSFLKEYLKIFLTFMILIVFVLIAFTSPLWLLILEFYAIVNPAGWQAKLYFVLPYLEIIVLVILAAAAAYFETTGF